MSSKGSQCSIARMTSPQGWVEPGQTPEFDEYTLVLRGALHVAAKSGPCGARRTGGDRAPGGMGAVQHAGEGGAEYVAVCLPAFSPDTCIATGRA